MLLFIFPPIALLSLRESFSMHVVESEHVLQNKGQAKHEEPLKKNPKRHAHS